MTTKNGKTDSGLVLLDVGNSRLAMARWSKDFRTAAQHVAHEPIDTVVELLQRQWDELSAATDRAVVASSVNPPMLEKLEAVAVKRGIAPFLVIGRDIEPPIEADLPNPERVGTDRLCIAAAAFQGFKCACVAADFGTALTVDLVADNGVFLGGTILPGLNLCARALHEHTALLPLVDFEAHDNATLGKDTRSAIRNGIHAMMIGALREITERYAMEIGKWPPLVVTGGDAEMIARHCDFVDRIVPDLCLDGLALAYKLHVNPDQE
ncbi:MAG TPA: type III pantothenate kinase [Phycisphaerae bacterium]|nr:type III pantothenate kinase [Phycisphaerae bacterium]HOB73658.1 type III pantothenate kinase [Phycisphaerae bacterium]HPU31935.1 type III pantothenate kinase [Phycisphaerae bacterium]HQE43978.1 type III pantothenate kinase [Phycisphaerae bacterium]